MKWVEFGIACGFILSMMLALLVDFDEFWVEHHRGVTSRVAAYTDGDDALVPAWARDTFAAIDALPTLETTAEMES